MFLLCLQLFCMSMIFAVVKVKHVAAFQYRQEKFDKEGAYGGILPNDDFYFTKSFKGVSKIRCCVNCKYDRPHCAGVLYNKHQMKCIFLKRYLTAAERDGNLSHEGDWEYLRITKDYEDMSECKRSIMGWDYRGNMSVTKSGRTCQEWASQSPHSHTKGTKLLKNHCRNPDEELSPWCYTTDPDKRYEWCDIPLCVTPILECLTHQDPTGIYYFGTQNVTDTGDLCQRWDSQTPHDHYHRRLADEGNYCRNPENYNVPWCYTVNPDKRWGKCSIPRC